MAQPGYRGPLTPQQVAAGMNCARENAQRLLEDAGFLLDAGHYPSAAALAVLSIEESGKVAVLRQVATAGNNPDALAEAWRAYRSHTKKNAIWMLPDLAHDGARSLDDFKPLFAEDADHPQVLDGVKQIAFYTDCYRAGLWSIPKTVIDLKLATNLVKTARVFAGNAAVTTPREMELWVRHLSPMPVGVDAMKQALLAWHSEMLREGLMKPGDFFEKFVRGVH